jgi:hypothetical protein
VMLCEAVAKPSCATWIPVTPVLMNPVPMD